jgi:hypothetical protein
MALLAHAVGFAEPALQFGIEVGERAQAEMVNVVARANGLDAREAGIFQASRQDDVTV